MREGRVSVTTTDSSAGPDLDCTITLDGPDLPFGEFTVVRIAGREAVSELFRFEIDLASSSPDLDFTRALFKEAVLSIKVTDRRRRFHGLISEVTVCDKPPGHLYLYTVVLVPRVAALTYPKNNQVYQNMTVPEILRAEITAGKRTGLKQIFQYRLEEDDVVFRLKHEPGADRSDEYTARYETKEYTVQYEESDFDFISRLMEREGLFYVFEMVERADGGLADVLVITDFDLGFPGDAYDVHLVYGRGEDNVAPDTLTGFSKTIRQVPGTAVVNGYDFLQPQLNLYRESTIADDGVGFHYSCDEHDVSEREADRLARIRAEALAMDREMFAGHSLEPSLTAGCALTIAGHFRDEFNVDRNNAVREYRVLSVDHVAYAGVARDLGLVAGEGAASYSNSFTCIPSKVPYRTPLRTPRPKITGIIHAHIDAEAADMPEPDAHGRYRVRLPFDLTGTQDGKASHYIRLATPFVGPGSGMHFPLLKGTEVLLSHVHGDPDRPIIIGCVPHAETGNVVARDTADSSRIVNQSGVSITLGHSRARKTLSGGGRQHDVGSDAGVEAGTTRRAIRPARQHLMGEEPGKPGELAGTPPPVTDPMNHVSMGQEHHTNPTTKKETTNKNIILSVPGYAEDANGKEMDSYLRIGSPPLDQKAHAFEKGTIDKLDKMMPYGMEEFGWFDYTDGLRVSKTKGAMHTWTYDANGFPIAFSYSGSTKELGKTSFDYKASKSGALSLGMSTKISASADTSASASSKLDMSVGTSVKGSLSFGYDMSWGFKMGYSNSGKCDISNGETYSFSSKAIKTVANKVTIGVADDSAIIEAGKANEEKIFFPLGGLVAGAIAGAVYGGVERSYMDRDAGAGGKEIDAETRKTIDILSAVDGVSLGGAATCAAATAAGLATYLSLKKKSSLAPPDPRLEMDDERIRLEKASLGAVPAGITIEKEKIELSVGTNKLVIDKDGITIQGPSGRVFKATASATEVASQQKIKVGVAGQIGVEIMPTSLRVGGRLAGLEIADTPGTVDVRVGGPGMLKLNGSNLIV